MDGLQSTGREISLREERAQKIKGKCLQVQMRSSRARLCKLINRNLIQIGAGRARRGISHALPLIINQPNGKRHNFHLQRETGFLLYSFSRKKEDLFLSWKPLSHWTTVTIQPTESTTPQAPSLLQGALCLQQSLGTAPIPLGSRACLRMEICSEKCFLRRYRHCGTITAHAYAHLDGTACYTPSLYGTAFCC